MRFIAVGDIAVPDKLNDLLELDLKDYAFMLLAGDMSGSPDGWKIGRARALNDITFIPNNKNPKEYYEELLVPSIEKLKKVDENLGHLKKYLQVYVVYGNTDFQSVVERVQPRNFILLHKLVAKVDDMFLVGYNGHPMYPWEIQDSNKRDIFGYTFAETAKELNSFKEDEIYDQLLCLCRSLPNKKVILLTHTPPYRILDKVEPERVEWAKASYGETAKEGSVGSLGLRRFIEDYQPVISVFGHIHESKGIQLVNGTTCINVGCFDERGEFASVNVQNGKIDCKFEKVG